MNWWETLIGGYVTVQTQQQNQEYPEQNQPQVESTQTPASAAAVDSIYGVPKGAALVGGVVLLSVILILATRK